MKKIKKKIYQNTVRFGFISIQERMFRPLDFFSHLSSSFGFKVFFTEVKAQLLRSQNQAGISLDDRLIEHFMLRTFGFSQ